MSKGVSVYTLILSFNWNLKSFKFWAKSLRLTKNVYFLKRKVLRISKLNISIRRVDWMIEKFSLRYCVNLEQFNGGNGNNDTLSFDVKLVKMILFHHHVKLVNERFFVIRWFNKERPKVCPTLTCIVTQDLDRCCQVKDMILKVQNLENDAFSSAWSWCQRVSKIVSKLAQGQCHGIKGQGHMYCYVQKLVKFI